MHVAVVEKNGKRFPAMYVCIGFVVFALIVVALGYFARTRMTVLINEEKPITEQFGDHAVYHSNGAGQTELQSGSRDKEPITEVKSNSLDVDWLKSLLLPGGGVGSNDVNRPTSVTEGYNIENTTLGPISTVDNWVTNETPSVNNSTQIANSSHISNSSQVVNSSQINMEATLAATLAPEVDQLSQTPEKLHTAPMEDGSRCLNYPTYRSVKDFLSQEIQSLEDSEKNHLEDYRRALDTDSHIQVIEVGASMGLYSLVAAGMGRSALIVEPNHACALYIQRMIRNTDLVPAVLFLEVAISNTSGYGLFGNDSDGVTSVPDDEVTIQRLTKHEIFKIMTLNQLSYHVTWKRAILKIHIMSLEPALFEEAQVLFDTISIPYVFMDWAYSDDRAELVQKTIHFLLSNDFRPREHLKNGFSLSTANFEFWPERIIWAKKSLSWDN